MEKVISLNFVNGYFVPSYCDYSVICEICEESKYSFERNLLDGYRVPERNFEMLSSLMVRNGYALKITNYTPKISPMNFSRFTSQKSSLPRKDVGNYCHSCYLRGICDDDYCARR